MRPPNMIRRSLFFFGRILRLGVSASAREQFVMALLLLLLAVFLLWVKF